MDRLITRRQTILGLGVAGGVVALGATDTVLLQELAAADAPLWLHAARAGLLFGSALGLAGLRDAPYATQVARDCSIVTPESEMKWRALRPAPDRFQFADGDAVLMFARRNFLLTRGHTLVWHQALPDWFGATATRANAVQLLTTHIQTVVGHYAGRLHSWDVVNEAIHLADRRTDGLRASPWLDLVGPDYLEIAFHVARAADPQAILVYNDYGLEYDDAPSRAKREAVLALLAKLKARNAPVQALGVQAHVDAAHFLRAFNPVVYADFLAQVRQLGLQILVTELDARCLGLPGDIAARDTAVARVYREFLAVTVAERAVISVQTWGLSDAHTWIAAQFPRPDGLPVRPLPLDAANARKPAWTAIAQVLERAPRRE